MAQLLIVHHTPSPSVEELVDAIIDGAGADAIEGVEVTTRAALAAPEADVLAADGYVLATPANLGSMSGALKHFFDRIYYPCRRETTGRPYGLCVHGNNDTTGAVSEVETVIEGLEWQQAHEHVTVLGGPDDDDLEACWELGAAVAAGLTM